MKKNIILLGVLQYTNLCPQLYNLFRLCEVLQSNLQLIIRRNIYGRLVVMDIEYYEKTMSKIYEAKLVNDGLADIENGKTLDGDSVRARMAEKYGV